MQPQKQNSRAVFVDTAAFYGFMDRRDQWHEAARVGFAKLSGEARELYTTNLVITETHSLLLRRLGHAVALGWLEALDDINLVFQSESHHSRITRLMIRYADHGYSYADSLSFVVMEEMGIPTAFTFDQHFLAYGFQLFE